jgi:hypothetical protein
MNTQREHEPGFLAKNPVRAYMSSAFEPKHYCASGLVRLR